MTVVSVYLRLLFQNFEEATNIKGKLCNITGWDQLNEDNEKLMEILKKHRSQFYQTIIVKKCILKHLSI